MKRLLFFIVLLITASMFIYSQENPEYKFIKAKNNKLYAGNSKIPIYLRGVCFGNRVWVLNEKEIPSKHHSEEDYKRIKELGMNCVRFYLSYKTFESDSRPFHYNDTAWEWLDQNIEWARKYGVYLNLNIHIPQGGFQSLGLGHELWNNPKNQKRLIALWKAIAQRYKDEPVISGYDLLNEPIVTKSIDQWKKLAQNITMEIRKVDKNHLIIIEQTLGIKDKWETFHNPDINMFLVNDPEKNVMYDFHFYFPLEYTHQHTSWTGMGEGGKYPDDDIYTFPPDITYAKNAVLSEKITTGTSKWTYVESPKFVFTETNIISAKPNIACHKIGKGIVYFDDIIVKEYDENGKFIRETVNHNIEKDTDTWGLWTENGTGKTGFSISVKHSGKSSFFVKDTTSWASCYNQALRFIPVNGHQYTVSGWIKGSNLPDEAQGLFQIELEKSPSNGEVHKRNKQYLEYELNEYLEFGRKHNVPMNIGEFGLNRACFENNRNGIKWVSDLLDLMIKYNVNFTYHSYHEYNSFGIYYSYSGLPDPKYVNTELLNLFREKLK